MSDTIRILTDFADKQRTRALYEQAFDDPKGFVDYYYREKCKDNTMVVLERDGRVLSMLHLNPYTLSVCGRTVPSYYIVAVATDKNHHRKGYMAQVLAASFQQMEEERVPFCFLLPVDEAIYRDFGFETICPFLTRDDPLSALPHERVQADYDVFCIRDDIYLRRQKEEDLLAAEGDKEVLPESPVIMARVTHPGALSEALSLPADTPPAILLARLRELHCFFREEV